MNLALGVVTTAGIIVLLEFSLPFLLPHWAPPHSAGTFWRYDDLLGWTHKPGQRGTHHHTDFSVTVSINSQGLRDKEYPLARVAGKKRLLVLGDSFGWGWGVEDRETFAKILESRYPNWEIINASVSGYGTDQEFLYFKTRGVHYRPDIVLVLFYQNDIYDDNNTELWGYNKARFQLVDDKLLLTNYPVPQASLRQRIERYVSGKTVFLAKLYYAAMIIKDQFSRQRVASGTTSAGVEYDVTKHVLYSLDEAIRENGSRLIVVSVPTSSESVKRFLSQTLNSKGILYLPLDEAFAETSERAPFEYDHHWNATGHRVAAMAIESFLRDRGVFP